MRDHPIGQLRRRLARLEACADAGPVSDGDLARHAFARAVDAVTAASTQLLDALRTTAPAKNLDVEAAKARARAAQRFAA